MHPVTRFIRVIIPGVREESAETIINDKRRRTLFENYLKKNMHPRSYRLLAKEFNLEKDTPDLPPVKYAELPKKIQRLIDWVEPEVLGMLMHGDEKVLETIEYAQEHARYTPLV